MTTPPPMDQDPLSQLNRSAAELIGKIDDLNAHSGEQFGRLSRTARRNRLMIWALAFSLFFDVVLTIFMGTNLVKINHLTNQVNQEQKVSREEALCPLYQIFLDSKSPQAKAQYPQGPAAYEHVFKQIHHGYDALQCQELKK